MDPLHTGWQCWSCPAWGGQEGSQEAVSIQEPFDKRETRGPAPIRKGTSIRKNGSQKPEGKGFEAKLTLLWEQGNNPEGAGFAETPGGLRRLPLSWVGGKKVKGAAGVGPGISAPHLTPWAGAHPPLGGTEAQRENPRKGPGSPGESWSSAGGQDRRSRGGGDGTSPVLPPPPSWHHKARSRTSPVPALTSRQRRRILSHAIWHARRSQHSAAGEGAAGRCPPGGGGAPGPPPPGPGGLEVGRGLLPCRRKLRASPADGAGTGTVWVAPACSPPPTAQLQPGARAPRGSPSPSCPPSLSARITCPPTAREARAPGVSPPAPRRALGWGVPWAPVEEPPQRWAACVYFGGAGGS